MIFRIVASVFRIATPWIPGFGTAVGWLAECLKVSAWILSSDHCLCLTPYTGGRLHSRSCTIPSGSASPSESVLTSLESRDSRGV